MYSSGSCEEKIHSFHICSVFVNLVIDHLKDDSFAVYFIRTVSIFLLNLIRMDSESNSILRTMACKYFLAFLTCVLPTFTQTIHMFFSSFVSVLVPIATQRTAIGKECLVILDYLIVSNAEVMKEALTHVDPFPASPQFDIIRGVYLEATPPPATSSLENEIRHFLSSGGAVGSRTEGLRYLKSQLAKNKPQLKQLYEELQTVRGFSEDCQRSILHRLICQLVTLALSADSEVRALFNCFYSGNLCILGKY